MFGWTADETSSFELLDRCGRSGLAIDTADSYSSWVPGNVGGESETILGKWLKHSGRRNAMVLITKVGSAVGPYPKDLRAKHILAAAEDSLRRLQTDHIDVYLSHGPDSSTAIEETLTAYQTLLGQGKVLAIGASNYDSRQLQDALSAGRRLRCRPTLSCSPNITSTAARALRVRCKTSVRRKAWVSSPTSVSLPAS